MRETWAFGMVNQGCMAHLALVYEFMNTERSAWMIVD